MNLTETLHLLSQKEPENNLLLEQAISLKRHRQQSKVEILQASDAFCLPAVNTKARIKWGKIFVRNVFEFFYVADNDNRPRELVFLVTIADRSHLTSDQPQQINLRGIKRKLGSGLKGLSYIGMVEPGYYNAIYDDAGEKRENVVSWHGHFIVWGVTRKQLAKHLEKMRTRFTPIMPGLCAVHKKAIEPDQFGYKLWYIVKSPRKEYSIGRRRESDKETGAPRYKQNSRPIRSGNRVKLFHLMRDIYLDELAMAGGAGRELLRKIKYEALREYRTKYGWDDHRP